MAGPYSHCPHCNELRDHSNRYTSPENARLDEIWWEGHLNGDCNDD